MQTYRFGGAVAVVVATIDILYCERAVLDVRAHLSQELLCAGASMSGWNGSAVSTRTVTHREIIRIRDLAAKATDP